MPETDHPADPHTLVEHYLHPDAKVSRALKLLKITPAEYSHLLANRPSRVSR